MISKTNNAFVSIDNEVLSFLSTQLNIPISSLHNDLRIFHDAGIDGDDAVELLEAYAGKFNVDLKNFHFFNYFGAESTLSPLRFFFRLFSKSVKEDKKSLTVRDLINAASTGELK